jgi:hypothetical protein
MFRQNILSNVQYFLALYITGLARPKALHIHSVLQNAKNCVLKLELDCDGHAVWCGQKFTALFNYGPLVNWMFTLSITKTNFEFPSCTLNFSSFKLFTFKKHYLLLINAFITFFRQFLPEE